MTARTFAAPLDTRNIHRKTSAGRDQLTSRNTVLTPRQRQLLVLVDGQRCDGELAALIGQERFQELIAALRTQGLVIAGQEGEPAAADPGPLAATVLARPAAAPLSVERLDAIRALMRDSAHRHLGLLAQETQVLIERANCTRSLQTAIAGWHLALRESRNGHAVADGLLDSVRTLLEGG